MMRFRCPSKEYLSHNLLKILLLVDSLSPTVRLVVTLSVGAVETDDDGGVEDDDEKAQHCAVVRCVLFVLCR